MVDELFDILDLGANADAKPINVLQHALMAKAYMLRISQGVEENLPLKLIKYWYHRNKDVICWKNHYKLLAQDSRLNFYGNIEAWLVNGVVDIIVADGFTGNAVLKTMEGDHDPGCSY